MSGQQTKRLDPAAKSLIPNNTKEKNITLDNNIAKLNRIIAINQVKVKASIRTKEVRISLDKALAQKVNNRHVELNNNEDESKDVKDNESASSTSAHQPYRIVTTKLKLCNANDIAVQEMIKIINKYNNECRSPTLEDKENAKSNALKKERRTLIKINSVIES